MTAPAKSSGSLGRFLSGTVPVWLLLVGVVAIGILTLMLFLQRAAVIRNGLAADSLAVARDTSRFVARIREKTHDADTAAVERDVWQRRALQAATIADSLDRRLKQQPKARVDVGVRLKTDTIHDTTFVSVNDAGDRSAHFDEYAPPFRIASDVTLPTRGAGRIRSIVAADPIDLSLRTLCGPTSHSVRPATIEVRGPTWATLAIDHAQQDPVFCNPSVGLSLGLRLPWWTDLLALLAGFAGGVAVSH